MCIYIRLITSVGSWSVLEYQISPLPEWEDASLTSRYLTLPVHVLNFIGNPSFQVIWKIVQVDKYYGTQWFQIVHTIF